jgi:hypothetical protein
LVFSGEKVQERVRYVDLGFKRELLSGMTEVMSISSIEPEAWIKPSRISVYIPD